MSIIKQSIRNLYRHELENEVKMANCKTPSDVLDILFGTYNNDYSTDYVVKRTWMERQKQSIIQRINTLWVYPVFILLIPIRYVLFGEYRVSEDSTFGKILIGLIGELR